jgi:Xaa-Pro dipeptidase
MTGITRRTFFTMTTAGVGVAAAESLGAAEPDAGDLTSLTRDIPSITAQEHAGRVGKLQSLMRQRGVGALLVEAGSSLEYFTGIRWWRSERTTADGGVVIVTPFFEEPSIRETLRIPADVRTWREDESPFELIAGGLRDRAPKGALAVEATTRYFIIDSVGKTLGSGRPIVSGDGLVRACRMIKSSAELRLMQAANDVTLAALNHVHRRLVAGMGMTDIKKILVDTTEALGGSHQFSLVLLNEASSYPHGSEKPQSLREGSVVLIDTGCAVHGYQSDISRTWVFGEPSSRQREVWDTVKRGQEIALETAKIGIAVGAVDKAVREYYEGRGWTRDYGLPGTSHRTGHGIGMDGHEPPNLVRNDTTPFEAGMCFSDEPGIYIPGEFGIRMEDCWYMTEAGPKLFTSLARSIEQPI